MVSVKPRSVAVPPDLPARKHNQLIAFVGEAPGADEMMAMRPFVGAAGRVFNALLRTANITRTDHLITNVFDTKVPDNDLRNWCTNVGEAREGGYDTLPPLGSAGFLKPEHHYHLERLRQELEEWQPAVIVPLGGTALWALSGSASISAMRGGISMSSSLMPGRKLLPTFHPIFVMQKWQMFPVVVGDMLKAAREASRGPIIQYPHKEITIEPDLDDLANYLPILNRSDLLSVDIETGWGQITCIGFAPSNERALVVPFLDKRRPDRNFWPDAQSEATAREFVRHVMESDVPKLGQNFGGYDAMWLLGKWNIKPVNYREDTRLIHHALYPELPKDLEFMGASYTDQGPWKYWGRKSSKEKRDD